MATDNTYGTNVMGTIQPPERVAMGKRSGLTCGRVSIGAMRLPADTDEAVALLRQAIDAGMTYIDTSRGYGDSEIKVGKALKDGYREKVILSTKWAPWVVKIEPDDAPTADCTYKRIRESMSRLDVEYLDFYQVWSVLKPEHFEAAVAPGGMVDGIRRAMGEGLVRHTGMTTHDKPENILDQLDRADWCEAILLSYNIMSQAYGEAIAKAHEKGIATIVMNPVAGGILAEESPILNRTIPGDDLVEVAHRYLKANPTIDTVLCGMTRPSDVTSTLANYAKPPLSDAECRSVERATATLSKEAMSFCTNCGYCKPCPQGLDIPGILGAVYLARLLEAPETGKSRYSWWAQPARKNTASDCTACGKCEERCTQKIPIIDHMRFAAETFD